MMTVTTNPPTGGIGERTLSVLVDDHPGILNRVASLLRRPQGRLTPEGLHAARPWRLPLEAEEARAMAAELAPSHNPHWLWQRFETYEVLYLLGVRLQTHEV